MDAAFLTGATGFVGASLARLLLRQGLHVKALVRKDSDRSNLTGLDIEVVQGDVLDRQAVTRGVAGCRYVFHLAADYRLWVADPRPMYLANVDGAELVLRAAAQAGAERIVHCSSVAAIRVGNDHVPVDETSEYAGVAEIIGHYKKSKYLADVMARRLARDEALPVVIVNPATPIGPRDAKPTPTGRIVADFLHGHMPSYLDTGLCVVHVEDVAMGHWLAATKGRIGERYVLGGDNLTLKQVLDLLSEVSGLPAPRWPVPYGLAYVFSAVDSAWARLRGSEPIAPLDAVRMARHYMWFSSAKAQRELNYSARPAVAALRDAVVWFSNHGCGAATRQGAS